MVSKQNWAEKRDLGSPLPLQATGLNEEAEERTPAQAGKLDVVNVVCHVGAESLSHCHGVKFKREKSLKELGQNLSV